MPSALQGFFSGGHIVSGQIESNHISSGSVRATAFASGAIIGVSGFLITVNSSGQLVIGIAVPLL